MQDLVGWDIRFSSLGINDIGSKDGSVGLAYPFVIDGVPSLYIVVAERLCVLLEKIGALCGNVGQLW